MIDQVLDHCVLGHMLHQIGLLQGEKRDGVIDMGQDLPPKQCMVSGTPLSMRCEDTDRESMKS